MGNILFSDEYGVLTAFLLERRKRTGVSQRELSRRMRRSQGHVHKIETRQRRVEIIEFCRYVEALGIEPEAAFQDLLRRLRE